MPPNSQQPGPIYPYSIPKLCHYCGHMIPTSCEHHTPFYQKWYTCVDCECGKEKAHATLEQQKRCAEIIEQREVGWLVETKRWHENKEYLKVAENYWKIQKLKAHRGQKPKGERNEKIKTERTCEQEVQKLHSGV